MDETADLIGVSGKRITPAGWLPPMPFDKDVPAVPVHPLMRYPFPPALSLVSRLPAPYSGRLLRAMLGVYFGCSYHR